LLLLLGCCWAVITRLSCCDRGTPALHPHHSDLAVAAALLRHTRVRAGFLHHLNGRSPANPAAELQIRDNSDSTGVLRAAIWAGAAGVPPGRSDCIFQRASTDNRWVQLPGSKCQAVCQVGHCCPADSPRFNMHCKSWSSQICYSMFFLGHCGSATLHPRRLLASKAAESNITALLSILVLTN